MPGLVIRPVAEAELGDLHAALVALSRDLGDTHRAGVDELRAAGFGAVAAFHALIARREAAVVGAAMASPVFSTTRGAAGVYVSDLWVAAGERGRGTGRRLLAETLRLGRARWGAGYVRLVVYGDNAGARGFYERLGFVANPGEQFMSLQGAAARRLVEET